MIFKSDYNHVMTATFIICQFSFKVPRATRSYNAVWLPFFHDSQTVHFFFITTLYNLNYPQYVHIFNFTPPHLFIIYYLISCTVKKINVFESLTLDFS